jgi:hypothetical protein
VLLLLFNNIARRSAFAILLKTISLSTNSFHISSELLLETNKNDNHKERHNNDGLTQIYLGSQSSARIEITVGDGVATKSGRNCDAPEGDDLTAQMKQR